MGRNPYSPAFYDQIRAGVQSSASVIVPLALNMFRDNLMMEIRPKVIDVGCGEGWFAQAFADAGCDVIGVDGGHVGTQVLGDRFLPHDLRDPLPGHLTGQFNLAVCLEVAEHLPATRGPAFVGDLCSLASIVLFSAAIPGQGGAGHVNEQPVGYWVEQFGRHGYEVSGALRWTLWNDARVEPWYAQNLIVAADADETVDHPDLFASPLTPPWPVVHPTIYDWRRQ